jgi:hypothetical protein
MRAAAEQSERPDSKQGRGERRRHFRRDSRDTIERFHDLISWKLRGFSSRSPQGAHFRIRVDVGQSGADFK